MEMKLKLGRGSAKRFRTVNIFNFHSICNLDNHLFTGIVERHSLFITSKLWNTYHKKEHVELAIEKSLSDMKLRYFDLYMIHFPISQKYVPFDIRYPPEWIYDAAGWLT